VLKNAKIVNVFTDRVEEGNVAIKNGMIVGIGDEFEGIEEIDLEGQYLTSALLTPIFIWNPPWLTRRC
jgi:adenine deaminase